MCAGDGQPDPVPPRMGVEGERWDRTANPYSRALPAPQRVVRLRWPWKLVEVPTPTGAYYSALGSYLAFMGGRLGSTFTFPPGNYSIDAVLWEAHRLIENYRRKVTGGVATSTCGMSEANEPNTSPTTVNNKGET